MAKSKLKTLLCSINALNFCTLFKLFFHAQSKSDDYEGSSRLGYKMLVAGLASRQRPPLK
jgi:hypothetical protein